MKAEYKSWILYQMFPTLEFHMFKSAGRYGQYCVGVRPKGQHEYVWIYTPIKGFPDDALKLQLNFIA